MAASRVGRFGLIGPVLVGVLAGAGQAPAQSPITTTYAHNNSGTPDNAVFFDLDVRCYLTLTAIDTNADMMGSLEVWITPDTHAGKELVPAEWSMVGSGTMTAWGGLGAPSPVPLAAPICLTPGQYGVQLRAVGFTHHYTNGSNTYSTAEVTLTAGSATNSPGATTGTVFSPRTWNGSLYYEAQNVDSGLMMAAGMSYVVDGNTHRTSGAPMPTRAVFTKKDGLQGGRPSPWPSGPWPSGRPDFTFNRMIGMAQVDVDALSIGEDKLWVDPGDPANFGKITMRPGPGAWLAFSLSVTRDSSLTEGTIAIEGYNDAGGDGVGADVFTYVSVLSDVPAKYQGATFRAMDGADLDMDTPTGLGLLRPEIAAVDAHMPVYLLDDAMMTALPGSAPRPTVYFSVTDATKGSIPGPWLRGTMVGARSGATIFSTTWDGSNWSLPQVFCTPMEIGLTPADDVDALAIDWTHRPDVHIVYSTVDGYMQTPPVELWFVARSTLDILGGPIEYRDNNDEPVTESSGANPVDAVCGSDPGSPQAGTDPRLYLWGRPEAAPGISVSTSSDANIAMLRSCYRDTAGNIIGAVATYLSGWEEYPPAGSGVEVAFLVVSPGDPTTTMAPVIVHSFVVRSLQIDAVESAVLRYPASSPALRGLDLYSFWACFNDHLYTSDFSRIRI